MHCEMFSSLYTRGNDISFEIPRKLLVVKSFRVSIYLEAPLWLQSLEFAFKQEPHIFSGYCIQEESKACISFCCKMQQSKSKQNRIKRLISRKGGYIICWCLIWIYITRTIEWPFNLLIVKACLLSNFRIKIFAPSLVTICTWKF